MKVSIDLKELTLHTIYEIGNDLNVNHNDCLYWDEELKGMYLDYSVYAEKVEKYLKGESHEQ